MVKNNEKQFKNIKLVCSTYFEKYDSTLTGVLDQSKEVMEKYKEWSKILIEPSSMNEARVYTLETKLQVEEDIRVREF